MSHEHKWEPIPGKMAQYYCLHCPANGFRNRTGQIVELAPGKRPPREPTVGLKGRTGRVGLIPKDPDDHEC